MFNEFDFVFLFLHSRTTLTAIRRQQAFQKLIDSVYTAKPEIQKGLDKCEACIGALWILDICHFTPKDMG